MSRESLLGRKKQSSRQAKIGGYLPATIMLLLVHFYPLLLTSVHVEKYTVDPHRGYIHWRIKVYICKITFICENPPIPAKIRLENFNEQADKSGQVKKIISAGKYPPIFMPTDLTAFTHQETGRQFACTGEGS